MMVAFQETVAMRLMLLAPRSPSSALKALIPALGSRSQGTAVLICPQWLQPCVSHQEPGLPAASRVLEGIGGKGADRRGQEVSQPETPEIASGSPNPGALLMGSQ